jgi:hypothetical protein
MRELAGQKRKTRRDAHARIAQERLDPRPRPRPRARRRPRPRSVGVFCGEESPIASQLFCRVCLIVKHRDSRGRRTTTSTNFAYGEEAKREFTIPISTPASGIGA